MGGMASGFMRAGSDFLADVGTVQQIETDAANYGAQSLAAKYNAKALRQQAQVSTAQGAAEEVSLRRQNRQMQGAARAAAAQSGTGMGGSTGRVLEQNAILQELDALNIRYQTSLRGDSIEAEARQQDYTSSVADMNRKQVRKMGYIGLASTMLARGAEASSGGGGYGGFMGG